MMKLLAAVVAITATALLVSAQKQSITYSACSSLTCDSGCQKQNFASGECLKVTSSRTQASVKMTCSASRQMCSSAAVYSDAGCTDQLMKQDGVGNQCYFSGATLSPTSYLLSVGAIYGACVYVQFGSSGDFTCAAPIHKPTIMGYGKCVQINGSDSMPQYVSVKTPVDCTGVTYEYWNSSTSCSGAAVGTTTMWNSASACNQGVQVSCGSSSGIALNKNGGQRSIAQLPEEIRRKLSL